MVKGELIYDRLEYLLREQRWQEADEETAQVLLKLCDREAKGYLTKKEVASIPASVLETVDCLWTEHSQSHFGFLIQRGLWELSHQNYAIFGEKVGWRSQEIWLNYEQLTFSLEAPLGHLPAVKFLMPVGDQQCFSFVLGTWRIALLSRRDWSNK